jgi:hypothetical protein
VVRGFWFLVSGWTSPWFEAIKWAGIACLAFWPFKRWVSGS